jgi:hypothetical protein
VFPCGTFSWFVDTVPVFGDELGIRIEGMAYVYAAIVEELA